MDIISAKLGANMAISELSASGQIGGIVNTAYTYDGDPSKVVEAMGFSLVKVSDTKHDMNTVVAVKINHNGTEKTLSPSELIIGTEEGITTIGADLGSGMYALLCAAVSDELATMYDLTGGTYILAAIPMGIWATYIEFADTVKLIDPKYLRTIVDLTQFTDGTTTPNDVVVSATLASLQGGGSLREVSGRFPGLRKALSGDRELVLSMNNNGLVMKSSMFISTYNGVAMQCAFSGMLFESDSDAVYNLSIIFAFNANDISDELLTAWVVAKPIA